MASYALQTPPRVAHAKPPGPKKRERPKVGNNNGQLRISNTTSVGTRKLPEPKYPIFFFFSTRHLFTNRGGGGHIYVPPFYIVLPDKLFSIQSRIDTQLSPSMYGNHEMAWQKCIQYFPLHLLVLNGLALAQSKSRKAKSRAKGIATTQLN